MSGTKVKLCQRIGLLGKELSSGDSHLHSDLAGHARAVMTQKCLRGSLVRIYATRQREN
jgi:hypothetical protein